MDPIKEFKDEKKARIASYANNKELQNASKDFLISSNREQYSYNFTWMGRPIIQYPQDMLAMQELIWEIQPDLIIETGIAHGGSLIFYASIMELIGKGKVLGIDIDIREHNRKEIEQHPMFKRIEMIQGSSVSEETYAQVKSHAENAKTIMVCLDSNHTHDHVLKELELYAPFTSVNSYCVVFDTVVELLPDDMFPNRPWSVGDNPMTAMETYLKDHPEFEIDHQIDNKLLVSVAPKGYLKRLR